MTYDEIPPDVRRLLSDHIDSVVQLEILLLLHANPTREFAADDVARELRVDVAWARSQLADLHAAGILIAPAGAAAAGYRYAPRTRDLEGAVTGLAKAYADRRVSVIALVYSKPADPARSFAEAFRLRKKEKGDG